MTKFLECKSDFDEENKNNIYFSKSIVPVNGRFISNVKIRNNSYQRIEEYYKWQFINAIVSSGLFSKDYIGVEVHFPKGNKQSNPLKIDACIFNIKDWLKYYLRWIEEKDYDSIEKLRQHIIVAIEFKKSVNDDVKNLLSYITKIGITLGKEIKIKDVLNYDGSVLMLIDDKEVNISKKIASNIFVEKTKQVLK